MRIKILFLFLTLIAFTGATYAQNGGVEETDKKPIKKANARPQEPERKPEPFDGADVKTMTTKCVKLETGKGSILLEFFPESAPETVRNFLNLVAIKALNNTTFSRVVPDFVIQGGDLYTNENITDEFRWRAIRTIPDEPNQVKHEPGIISMARGDEPNTASTSFFILLTDYDALDGKFAAFGRVTEGMKVVKEINKMPVKEEKPRDPVKIVAASIFECGAGENDA